MPTFSHFSIVSSKVIIVKDRAENFDNPNIKSEYGLIFVGLIEMVTFLAEHLAALRYFSVTFDDAIGFYFLALLYGMEVVLESFAVYSGARRLPALAGRRFCLD
jgi:hypothetical protein